ncbi:MAG: glycosyltransferase [Planctomycetota bacterium]|nr:glycosyltransferase [Planctomycetota bacterium]
MNSRFRKPVMVAALGICLAYLIYRGGWTLNLTSPYAIFASLLLYLAEIYGSFSLLLFFLQVWDTSEPEELPPLKGRTVDILVPTYNEDVQLLRTTLKACAAMDYDHKTYVLDDGNRDDVRQLAADLGINYIARDNNLHAKAGNLNHALEQTDGEFIIIFDADHVPEKRFIKRLLGYFRDEKVGMVQTPHAFYNFDTFQGSLDYEKKRFWEEGQLFYNVIQPGKNRWNAVVFAGSAAMFRRKALEDVGYIAVETITEDMHTGLRMNALGWKSHYISERMIAGQAAPDVTTYHSQRLRWAEGNLSILFHDNPLTMHGLNMQQRLSYFGSIIHWAGGFPKLAIYLTPILLLFTGVPPVSEFSWTLAGIFAAYLIGTQGAVKLVSNGYGSLMNIELFSMMSFWTQIRATSRAMFSRKEQKFVVTSKRGRQAGSILPYVAPQVLLITGTILAIAWGAAIRLIFETSEDYLGLGIASFFALFHLYLAGVVVWRALRVEDGRFSFRHTAFLPVAYALGNEGEDPALGHGITADLNETGVNLVAYEQMHVGDRGTLTLSAAGQAVKVKAEIRTVRERPTFSGHAADQPQCYRYGIRFVDLTPTQHDALAELSLHYAVPQQYEWFGSRLSRLQRMGLLFQNGLRWPRRLKRHSYRLPFVLFPDQPRKSSTAVTEDLNAAALKLILSEPFALDTELPYQMPTPFGLITGTARVLRMEETTVGDHKLYLHVLEFNSFQGQSRGILQSLLVPSEGGHVESTLMPRNAPAPTQLAQPIAAGLIAALVLIPGEFGLFSAVKDDDLFLQQFLEDPSTHHQDLERVDSIYAATREKQRPEAYRLLLLKDTMAHLGRFEDSNAMTRRLLMREPNNLDLQLALADSLSNMDEAQSAADEFDALLSNSAALTKQPELHRLALLSSARNAVNGGLASQAPARYEQYLDLEPYALEVRNEYAGVLVASGRASEAAQLYDGILLDLGARYQLVDIHSAQGDFASAERECQRILELNPGDERAERKLAEIFSWNGSHGESLALYRSLAERTGIDQDLELKLARLSLWNKDYAEALRRFQALLDSNPEQPELWRDFIDAASGVSVLNEHHAESIRHIRLGLEDEILEDPILVARLGQLLRRLGRDTECVALLKDALRSHPADRQLRLNLADALHDLERFAEAEDHYAALLSMVD